MEKLLKLTLKIAIDTDLLIDFRVPPSSLIQYLLSHTSITFLVIIKLIKLLALQSIILFYMRVKIGIVFSGKQKFILEI